MNARCLLCGMPVELQSPDHRHTFEIEVQPVAELTEQERRDRRAPRVTIKISEEKP